MSTCKLIGITFSVGLLFASMACAAQIQVEDASAFWTQPLLYSSQISAALPPAVVRIVVANASVIRQTAMRSSEGLLSTTAQVRAHLIVEYASCVFTVSLRTSDEEALAPSYFVWLVPDLPQT